MTAPEPPELPLAPALVFAGGAPPLLLPQPMTALIMTNPRAMLLDIRSPRNSRVRRTEPRAPSVTPRLSSAFPVSETCALAKCQHFSGPFLSTVPFLRSLARGTSFAIGLPVAEIHEAHRMRRRGHPSRQRALQTPRPLPLRLARLRWREAYVLGDLAVEIPVQRLIACRASDRARAGNAIAQPAWRGMRAMTNPSDRRTGLSQPSPRRPLPNTPNEATYRGPLGG
jgi:hypothetical protein